MTTSLAHRATIQTLVAVYQAECDRIRRAFADIAEAERNLRAAFLDARGFNVCAEYSGGRSGEWERPEIAIAKLRRPAWQAIIERLELRRVMSASRWAECEKWLYSKELPDITLESVAEHARIWGGAIRDMLDEALRETFEYLRPRASKHKTNSQLEIPPKVILTSVMDSRSFALISDYHGPKLAAVERVFKSLNGKGQTTKGYYSDLESAIRDSMAARKNARGVYEDAAFDRETDYFRVRVFGNGNAHVWFKRLDLLAELNRRAGGNRLRPGKAA